jgi:hypothetical protein
MDFLSPRPAGVFDAVCWAWVVTVYDRVVGGKVEKANVVTAQRFPSYAYSS